MSNGRKISITSNIDREQTTYLYKDNRSEQDQQKIPPIKGSIKCHKCNEKKHTENACTKYKKIINILSAQTDD
jgi:hypothetical protein